MRTNTKIFSGSGLALTKEDRTSVKTRIDKVGAIAAKIVEKRATKKYFLFISNESFKTLNIIAISNDSSQREGYTIGYRDININ